MCPDTPYPPVGGGWRALGRQHQNLVARARRALRVRSRRARAVPIPGPTPRRGELVGESSGAAALALHLVAWSRYPPGSMPRRHLSPCLDCGTPTRGPRCDACYRDPWRSSPEWQLTRRVVLNRAGGRCELIVDDRCLGVATTVHLDPDAEGYPDHRLARPDDCEAACSVCHGIVDARRQAGRVYSVLRDRVSEVAS